MFTETNTLLGKTITLKCLYVYYLLAEVHVVVIPHRHIHLRGLVSMEGFNKVQQECLITLQQSSFVQ